MRRHRTLVLVLAAAALLAGCTAPTAPTAPTASTSQDQQITIGPHPNIIQRGR